LFLIRLLNSKKVNMLNQKKLFFCFIAFLFVLKVNAQTETTTEITLKASGMQYDQVRFRVRPGGKVKITLKNDDDMSHNLVITQPGAREEIVNAALALGSAGLKANYVPSSPKVLIYIPLLSPGQTDDISFTAPTTPGVYPYVCTFPGHGFVMFGAMYVTTGAMPAQKDDPNIPPSRKDDGAPSGTMSNMSMHSNAPGAAPAGGHPYALVPPFVTRAFLPDTGPAAIGVSLPKKLSYCWDAGTCRLRYAWAGEYIDFTDFWKSYKRYDVKILGTVFYRDKTPFPLHIDDPAAMPAVKFKGYSLIQRYPEFHYTIDGLDVYELIREKADGTGFTRAFRIPKTTKPIWFTFAPGDGVDYTCSKGQWVNGKLKLSPMEARQFTIIMTKKEGVKL
jgi:azurin